MKDIFRSIAEEIVLEKLAAQPPEGSLYDKLISKSSDKMKSVRSDTADAKANEAKLYEDFVSSDKEKIKAKELAGHYTPERIADFERKIRMADRIEGRVGISPKKDEDSSSMLMALKRRQGRELAPKSEEATRIANKAFQTLAEKGVSPRIDAQTTESKTQKDLSGMLSRMRRSGDIVEGHSPFTMKDQARTLVRTGKNLGQALLENTLEASKGRREGGYSDLPYFKDSGMAQ